MRLHAFLTCLGLMLGIGATLFLAYHAERGLAWLERRNAREDDTYAAMRLPGEGRLHLVADDDEVHANPYAALAPERIEKGAES